MRSVVYSTLRVLVQLVVNSPIVMATNKRFLFFIVTILFNQHFLGLAVGSADDVDASLQISYTFALGIIYPLIAIQGVNVNGHNAIRLFHRDDANGNKTAINRGCRYHRHPYANGDYKTTIRDGANRCVGT